mmetsp:Transcript_29709/g.69709  ORF Transcript_29709/g.69709 Transcript_29709/m.69709 type:complete len:138 (-) Transcript_29709:110-523(-)|eukprot:CAMPEP_0185806030 /NCGR_PEP_ID=MMETSP1322-20130828/4204_1 /TAXON_ID=265543 /ORGANISM="Minutocellus polymorphus, Strain RCC2270" /LENGTH=137 /DNA_ID=CAMNT_0028502101 /DNA_START=214 /DNA_END=627 /DNA_ORIENTATION=+
MSVLATFTTDRLSLVVAEILTLLFFASAILQLNDDDLIIWGAFYLCHTALAGSVIFRRKCPGGGHTLLGAAIGMTVWSVAMGLISLVRIAFGDAEKYSADVAREELMGAVLGTFAAGYFTTLLGKGFDKRNEEAADA